MEFLLRYIGSSELVIVCVVIFLVLLCHSLCAPLLYWYKRGVPFISAIPIFGSVGDSLFQRVYIGEIYMKMYRKLEDKRYGGFYKFCKPGIIVCDPKLIKNVLEVSFPSFHDNDLASNEDLESLLSQNLFVAPGERWKQLRSHLMPIFSMENMKSIYPLVEEVCENLNSYLDGVAGSELDFKDLCARFTTEVLSSCAFGIHSDAIHIPNSEFHLMAREMLDPSPCRAIMIMTLMQFPWMINFIPASLIPNQVSQFFRSCVREVVTYREREGTPRNDFMSILIQLKKEGKLAFKSKKKLSGASGTDKEYSSNKGSTCAWDPESINDVATQAFGFFVGGLETCASLMSFALFELAHEPDIQSRLRDEIKEVKQKYGNNLSFDAVQEIKYLEMVISETLRKYPPTSFIARLSTKPVKFPSPEKNVHEIEEGKELLLEADIPVVIPILAIHRDHKYYPNPDVFDPERFSEKCIAERDRFTYLPFGEGPRKCIGMKLGIMQCKAAIATILLSFELMPSDQTLPPIYFDPSQYYTSSKSNIYLYIRKIKS
ncbi:cytochrome P450 6k1-like [Ischnura elegans]|uniref:cytochrome P450 6k1-like n=1 Tax=Ischnura elegans TaxID=197161 RepID=UPI001ED8AC8C|nr:cytochrome P450 6k1-like [Ischnura elegans]